MLFPEVNLNLKLQGNIFTFPQIIIVTFLIIFLFHVAEKKSYPVRVQSKY